jgi:hypothetical protein
MNYDSYIFRWDMARILLTVEEAKTELSRKGWTNRALAAWWECREEYVSKIINNPARKRHFDDAIRGLPVFSKKQ